MFCFLLLINYHFSDLSSMKSSWINLFPINQFNLTCYGAGFSQIARDPNLVSINDQYALLLTTSAMEISTFSIIVITSSHLSEVLLIAVHYEPMFRLNLGVITQQIYIECSGSVRDMWTLDNRNNRQRGKTWTTLLGQISSFSIMRSGISASSLELGVRCIVKFTDKYFHLYDGPTILSSTSILLDLTAY